MPRDVDDAPWPLEECVHDFACARARLRRIVADQIGDLERRVACQTATHGERFVAGAEEAWILGWTGRFADDERAGIGGGVRDPFSKLPDAELPQQLDANCPRGLVVAVTVGIEQL